METQEMFLCRPEEPMVIFLFFPLLKKKIQQYFFNPTLSHVAVFIYFWPHLAARGISLPQPGIELRPKQ